MEILLSGDGYLIVDQFSEDGFVDCVFKIENLVRNAGHYTFDIRSSYSGQRLGLRIKMIANLGPGFDSKMNLVRKNVYYDGVEFFRSG
jgi:hypothetical protein